MSSVIYRILIALGELTGIWVILSRLPPLPVQVLAVLAYSFAYLRAFNNLWPTELALYLLGMEILVVLAFVAKDYVVIAASKFKGGQID
jgi:hypothetical protein